MRWLTIAIYLACAAGLIGLELAGRYGHGRVTPLASVLRWAARRRSSRIGLVMAWWWIGWHFLGAGG